jgi:hypothetical protein
MDFLRSVIVQDVTPAADGSYTYDLPVNPVSHIILAIKALNVTDEASEAHLAALVTNIEVLHRGTSIMQFSAADLLAIDHVIFGKSPLLLNQIATDNATRALILIIPFGRSIYNPSECFPESKAGELQLRLTVDIATTEADGLILQVEAIELLGASPSRHLKITTLSKTPSATGACDVDLPIHNVYAGLLLFSTTIPATTAWTTTVNQVKLLADNTEKLYSLSNWISLHGELLNRPGHEPGYIAADGNDHIANYSFMDFAPGNSDEFLLDSRPLSALKLRVTAGDTNVLRVLPFELQLTG